MYTWGKGVSDDKSTFSGLRSQWTMWRECRCFNAIRIYKTPPSTMFTVCNSNDFVLCLSIVNNLTSTTISKQVLKARKAEGDSGNTFIKNKVVLPCIKKIDKAFPSSCLQSIQFKIIASTKIYLAKYSVFIETITNI